MLALHDRCCWGCWWRRQQFASTDLSDRCQYFGGICNGDYGVTLFFVLSGFLIPYIIMAIYRKDQRTLALKRGEVRRAGEQGGGGEAA